MNKTTEVITGLSCRSNLLSVQSDFSLLRSEASQDKPPSAADIEALRQFARSTKLRFDPEYKNMILNGMSLDHYQADPELHRRFPKTADGINQPVPETFGLSAENFDLCLEDSWSGFFITKYLSSKEEGEGEPTVLIHLDDHTDMMPTLLRLNENKSADIAQHFVFDPISSEHWIQAIQSGAVGIGSFVTALFYRPEPLHVLHLRERTDDRCSLSNVYQSSATHRMIPKTLFANIVMEDRPDNATKLGTYTRHKDPLALLNDLPDGRIIVHVDLDYLINDYNGNIGSVSNQSVAFSQKLASSRMDAFFQALSTHKIPVERWIVGVSPGFCGFGHWQWLLTTMDTRISRYQGGTV